MNIRKRVSESIIDEDRMTIYTFECQVGPKHIAHFYLQMTDEDGLATVTDDGTYGEELKMTSSEIADRYETKEKFGVIQHIGELAIRVDPNDINAILDALCKFSKMTEYIYS